MDKVAAMQYLVFKFSTDKIFHETQKEKKQHFWHTDTQIDRQIHTNGYFLTGDLDYL